MYLLTLIALCLILAVSLGLQGINANEAFNRRVGYVRYGMTERSFVIDDVYTRCYFVDARESNVSNITTGCALVTAVHDGSPSTNRLVASSFPVLTFRSANHGSFGVCTRTDQVPGFDFDSPDPNDKPEVYFNWLITEDFIWKGAQNGVYTLSEKNSVGDGISKQSCYHIKFEKKFKKIPLLFHSVNEVDIRDILNGQSVFVHAVTTEGFWACSDLFFSQNLVAYLSWFAFEDDPSELPQHLQLQYGEKLQFGGGYIETEQIKDEAYICINIEFKKSFAYTPLIFFSQAYSDASEGIEGQIPPTGLKTWIVDVNEHGFRGCMHGFNMIYQNGRALYQPSYSWLAFEYDSIYDTIAAQREGSLFFSLKFPSVTYTDSQSYTFKINLHRFISPASGAGMNRTMFYKSEPLEEGGSEIFGVFRPPYDPKAILRDDSNRALPNEEVDDRMRSFVERINTVIGYSELQEEYRYAGLQEFLELFAPNFWKNPSSEPRLIYESTLRNCVTTPWRVDKEKFDTDDCDCGTQRVVPFKRYLLNSDGPQNCEGVTTTFENVVHCGRLPCQWKAELLLFEKYLLPNTTEVEFKRVDNPPKKKVDYLRQRLLDQKHAILYSAASRDDVTHKELTKKMTLYHMLLASTVPESFPQAAFSTNSIITHQQNANMSPLVRIDNSLVQIESDRSIDMLDTRFLNDENGERNFNIIRAADESYQLKYNVTSKTDFFIHVVEE